MLSSITSVLLLLQFVQHQFSHWYYNVVLYHIRAFTVTVRSTSVCSVILQCCPLSHPRLYCYSSPNISLLSDITMLSSITSAPLLLQFVQHQFSQWYYNVVLYHIRAFTVTVHPTSVRSVILQCCPLSHSRLYCYSSSNISLLSGITMLSSITYVLLLLQFTQHQFAQWYYNVVLYHIRSLTVTVRPTSVCSVILQCCPLSHPLLYCYSSPNISLLSGITMLSSITSVLLLLQFTQHQFAQWYYNVVLYHIRSLTVTVRPTSVCSVILQYCPLSHPHLYCYSSPNISLLSDITMLSSITSAPLLLQFVQHQFAQ